MISFLSFFNGEIGKTNNVFKTLNVSISLTKKEDPQSHFFVFEKK